MYADESQDDRTPRHTVTLHDRTVAYADWAGEREPILLVHGIGASLDTWGVVPRRLAAGRRVVAVDLPGHGRSDAGPGDYSLGAMATVLRDLLDRLDIERAHLVGHSLGGGVTMQFAYQFPERIASMTLESSGGLGSEAAVGLRAASLPGAELVLRLLAGGPVQSAAAWMARQTDRLGMTPEALTERTRATLGALAAADRRAAFVSTLRSVVGPDGQRVSALDRLHLMEGSRVLIVWGDRDPTIPVDHGVRAHELLPGSRLVVFAGAGHEPHAVEPERYARLVAAHVERCEREAGSRYAVSVSGVQTVVG